MRRNWEVGGGGGFGSVGWSICTVQRALVHDFRGPGFLANSWYGSSPTPLSLQLVCPPPFLEPKVGGGNTRMQVKGGSQFGRLERKPGTLFTLPVPNGRKFSEKSAKLVIDHVANKSVHFDSVGAFTL